MRMIIPSDTCGWWWSWKWCMLPWNRRHVLWRHRWRHEWIRVPLRSCGSCWQRLCGGCVGISLCSWDLIEFRMHRRLHVLPKRRDAHVVRCGQVPRCCCCCCSHRFRVGNLDRECFMNGLWRQTENVRTKHFLADMKMSKLSRVFQVFWFFVFPRNYSFWCLILLHCVLCFSWKKK